MKFTDIQLQSFIDLYKQEFGEEIDSQEAERQASALVSLVQQTYQPMTEREYTKYKKIAKSGNYDKL